MKFPHDKSGSDKVTSLIRPVVPLHQARAGPTLCKRSNIGNLHHVHSTWRTAAKESMKYGGLGMKIEKPWAENWKAMGWSHYHVSLPQTSNAGSRQYDYVHQSQTHSTDNMDLRCSTFSDRWVHLSTIPFRLQSCGAHHVQAMGKICSIDL